jgi:hypothetical protein
MIPTSEYPTVTFEIETNSEPKRIRVENLPVLPAVGDEVQCDYVHGEKVSFEVKRVKHHLSNIGHNILQQITVYGRSI